MEIRVVALACLAACALFVLHDAQANSYSITCGEGTSCSVNDGHARREQLMAAPAGTVERVADTILQDAERIASQLPPLHDAIDDLRAARGAGDSSRILDALDRYEQAEAAVAVQIQHGWPALPDTRPDKAEEKSVSGTCMTGNGSAACTRL